METTVLGRTGLVVSVAGLGCGGHSRLGQGYGKSPDDSVAVVRAAIDAGVNFIDTAVVYGTEAIVGEAVRGQRDSVVISTKMQIAPRGASVLGSTLISAEAYCEGLEASLARLKTDYVDILHLHGVMPDQYAYCRDELVPALLKLREQGKIRFLGLTERFIYDPQHRMLEMALEDGVWDVVMAGFNLINQSARDRVLAKTRAANIGTLNMFAVRRVLSRPAVLREMIDDLVDGGLIDPGALGAQDPLGFLVDEGGADSVIDGAYRFCRHEPGIDVVLTGTGSVAHLHENLASIARGPLREACIERLRTVFARVDSVSGD